MVSARLSRRCLTVFLTCFAQNIGSSVSLVASRYVVASAGVVLIALGLIPKFSALVAGMPAPVLGGASLIMFGSIVGSGVAQIKDSGPFDQRAAMVFSTSLALGLGFGLAPKDALMPFRHRWPCSWSRVWRLVEWRQLY
jgi:xanthine/uracil permease